MSINFDGGFAVNKHRFSGLVMFTVILTFGTIALQARAGNDTWTVAGAPSGGAVLKVVINPLTPSTLYACANGGTYKSTDSGASWTLVLPQLNNCYDVAVEPENPSMVYVATGMNGGLEVSSDAGATWTISNTGIPMIPGLGGKDTISEISVDPATDGTAYAVTFNSGIYKTANHGQSWAAINTGLASLIASKAMFGEVTVDPVNPQVLYLPVFFLNATEGNAGGIYKSTDGGVHWNPSTTGLFGTGQVVVDPNNDARVFAVSNYGIYQSTDSGTTWTQMTSSPPVVTVLGINPQNSENLVASTEYNGLYISTDGGATWAAGASDVSSATSITIDPVTPTNVYMSGSGIYKSTDGAKTMISSDTGIHGITDISNMVMGDDGVLYLGSGGIFKSTDEGNNWTPLNSGMTSYANTLVEDPKIPTTLYACTTDGLFKTINGGLNWTLLSKGITDPYTFTVAVDPENTLVVYAGTNSGGVFKSTDGGGSWQSTSTGLPSDAIRTLAVDPDNSSVIYAGTQSNGMYQSVDGGNTWGADNAGLPSAATVWAVDVDPTNDKIVYASIYVYPGPGDGIYKSSDGGSTWVSSGNGLPLANAFSTLIMDPSNASTLYAVGGFGENLFVTTDSGADWQPITPLGLPTTPIPAAISALAIDPRHPANLYGAASDGQVYAFSSLMPMATASNTSTLENTLVNSQLIGSLSGFTGQLSFDVVTPPTHGAVTITNPTSGAFSYTPATAFTGTDSFTFTVSAAGAVSAPATVTLAVNPPPPIATNGAASTSEGTAVQGQLQASGGGTLTFNIQTPPARGTVKLTDAATGAYTYTPSSGFSGTDSFTFTVSNAGGASAAATETITVTSATVPTAPGNPSGPSSSPSGGGGGGLGALGMLLLLGLGLLRRASRGRQNG